MGTVRNLWVVATSLTLATTVSNIGVANAGPVPLTPGEVRWKGNGTTIVDGRRVPTVMECVEGEPDYLIFKLTSTNNVFAPQIAFEGGTPQAMVLKNMGTRSGTYVKEYTTGSPIDVDALLEPESGGVVVTFTGNGRPTLTVARGCVRDPLIVGVARLSGLYPVNSLVSIYCGGYPDDRTYAFFCDAGIRIINISGNEQGLGWNIGTVDPADSTKLIPASFSDDSKFTSATFIDDGIASDTPVAPIFFIVRMDLYTLSTLTCDEKDTFLIVYDGITYLFNVDCP